MNDFKNYIENYKKLPLKEKQTIIIEQLELLAGFTNRMCQAYQIENDFLLDRELLDIKNQNYTEDDFAEAVIVLVNSIQNSLSDYNIGLNKISSKLLNEQK